MAVDMAGNTIRGFVLIDSESLASTAKKDIGQSHDKWIRIFVTMLRVASHCVRLLI